MREWVNILYLFEKIAENLIAGWFGKKIKFIFIIVIKWLFTHKDLLDLLHGLKIFPNEVMISF